MSNRVMRVCFRLLLDPSGACASFVAIVGKPLLRDSSPAVAAHTVLATCTRECRRFAHFPIVHKYRVGGIREVV